MWIKRSLFGFGAICFVLLVTGCAPHREMGELRFTHDMLGAQERYSIRVRLEIGDNYKSTTREDNFLEDYPFGPELTKHTEDLAENLFILVTQEDLEVDAVLIPEIISIDHLVASWAGQDSTLAITQKWTLSEPAGNLIWVQTISGEGVMETGTAFTNTQRTKERVLLAMDDLFAKSTMAIVNSVEIKQFSDRVSSQ